MPPLSETRNAIPVKTMLTALRASRGLNESLWKFPEKDQRFEWLALTFSADSIEWGPPVEVDDPYKFSLVLDFRVPGLAGSELADGVTIGELQWVLFYGGSRHEAGRALSSIVASVADAVENGGDGLNRAMLDAASRELLAHVLAGIVFVATLKRK